jgi:hypothetical protein
MVAWLINAALGATLLRRARADFTPNVTDTLVLSANSPLVQFDPPEAWSMVYDLLESIEWVPHLVGAGPSRMKARGIGPNISVAYPGMNVTVHGYTFDVDSVRADETQWNGIDGQGQPPPTTLLEQVYIDEPEYNNEGTYQYRRWESSQEIEMGNHTLTLGLAADSGAEPYSTFEFESVHIATSIMGTG